MAVKRRGGSAAPVKMKLRKHHGPKRKLWHGLDKVGRIDCGKAGILSKYWDKESFALACNARGVKICINELWNEYREIKLCKDKDVYLAELQEHLKKVLEKKNKKPLTKSKK